MPLQSLLLLRVGQAGDGSSHLLKTQVHDAAGPPKLTQLIHEYEIGRNLNVGGIVRPWSLSYDIVLQPVAY